MSQILTQKELSKMKCMVKDCGCGGIIYFHGRCHITAPVTCCYHPDGFITVSCAECDEEIVKIAVASGDGT